MATRTVVCPECGAEVPAGRLSCAACGTLIAAVAGAPRRTAANGSGSTGKNGDAPEPPGDVVDAASAASLSARGAAAEVWTTGMDAAEERPAPPILQDWKGPLPPGVVATTGPSTAPMPASPTWTPSARTSPPPTGLGPTAKVLPDPDASDSWDARPDGVAGDGRAPSVPPLPDRDAEPSWPSSPAVPGAYVAPSIVPTAAATVNGRPATATSIAAAAVADGSITSIPAQPRPDRWFSVPEPAKDGATPGKAGLFSDLPFRTPGDLPSWAVAVGALFGVVAFLLPWSSNIVIGGGVDDTWTGRWGLANPANLVLLVLALALVVVTLIPNPIPASIRGVVLPVLVGGLFLGIVWTYATGPFGLGWGVDLFGIGGIVLVLGGALGAARADDPPKPKSEPDAA